MGEAGWSSALAYNRGDEVRNLHSRPISVSVLAAPSKRLVHNWINVGSIPTRDTSFCLTDCSS